MGRTWIDSAVEGAEGLLARDLDAAERRAVELAKTAGRPSGRTRALALRVRVLAQRDNSIAALCLYTDARAEARRNRVSKLALAELDLAGSSVLIQMGTPLDARAILQGIRDDLEPEIRRAQENQSRGGKIRLRLLRKLLAKTWLASAFASLEESDPERAYRDARKAATVSCDETIQLSALSLLSVAASTHPDPRTLATVLGLLAEAESRLTRRANPPRLFLDKLRWIRALTLERAGLTEDADEIMSEVVEWFATSAYQEDAKRARADWERIRVQARQQHDRRAAKL